MKHTIVLLALLAACLQDHAGTQALNQTDCYACHKANYEGTPMVAASDPAVPDHLAKQNVYTTQCASCHVTSTWYSHPEALFNLQKGPHAGVKCDSCHLDSTNNAGDAHGANTLCTSCHPANEMVAGQTLTNDHIMHPNAIFPMNHKNNGVDRPCTACHTGQPLTTFDGYTNPPAGYTTSNFCLSCHPTGNGASSDAPCTRCHRDAHNQDQGDPSGCLQQGCHYGGAGGGN